MNKTKIRGIRRGGVYAWKRGRLGEKQMTIEDYKDVIKKVEKLTYTQDWKSYNLAKTREKTMALQLLTELLELIEIPEKKKMGRPSFTFKEQILSMFIYIWSRSSSRRAVADIEMAKRLKLISRTPCFTTILLMFNKAGMDNKLLELIEITSLPLRMFEDHLSVDSSGFSTSTFERWFNIRTQKPSKLRNWVKANLIVGSKTNIIITVTIKNGTSADCPELIPLVKKAVKHFNPKEISADKAYLSRNNLNTIAKVGAIPYIPMKSNSSRRPKGCPVWKATFDYFYNNQEEFMKHYHQRSNVETTFSMIKRNFGNKLRTKKFNSQVCEVLMKCLCHNLSVLVQESFELGLKIDLNKCAEIHLAHK